ncbi:hypothetical protein BJY52DRAFT_1226104, partial [Lactarius psammicola]
SLRVDIPSTIDVFLPGKSAWDAVKKKFIDEKLEKLGVEKGSGSSMPHIHAPHARAASAARDVRASYDDALVEIFQRVQILPNHLEKLAGRADIEKALKRLDSPTQARVQMVIAPVLKATTPLSRLPVLRANARPSDAVATLRSNRVDTLVPTMNPVRILPHKFPGTTEQHPGNFQITGMTGLQLIGTLSGGQKSRVAIVVASLLRPDILLFGRMGLDALMSRSFGRRGGLQGPSVLVLSWELR